MLNAIGSAALTNEKNAEASQKRIARAASVIDPKIKSKDQLRPSCRSQAIRPASMEWQVVSDCLRDVAGSSVLIVKVPCSPRTTKCAAFSRKISYVIDSNVVSAITEFLGARATSNKKAF